jgi:hypothetical protein
MLFICTPSSVEFIKYGTSVRARSAHAKEQAGAAMAARRAADGGAPDGTNAVHSTSNPLGKVGDIQMESGESREVSNMI